MSRRALLKGLSFAPFALRQTPLLALGQFSNLKGNPGDFSIADVHVSPHYPSQSPLTDIFRLVPPGSDEYPLEKHAVEIEALLNKWGNGLAASLESLSSLAALLEPQIEGSAAETATEKPIRTG